MLNAARFLNELLNPNRLIPSVNVLNYNMISWYLGFFLNTLSF